MNRCVGVRQSEEEMGWWWCSSLDSEGRDDGSLLCPKPRRLCELPACGDEDAGEEILDIFLAKNEQFSPPYFCGSPPSRVANPVVNDPRFSEDTLQLPVPGSPMSPSASPARGGKSCARIKFGFMPAAVRVEGFDRLGRNRRNRGITAVA